MLPIIALIVIPTLMAVLSLLAWNHARWRRRILVSWAVAAVLVLFVPLLFTLAWHVRHGSTFEYRGTRLRIPLMWTANINAEPVLQSVDLNKLPVSILSADKPEGWISIKPWPSPGDSPETMSKAWIAIFWNTNSGKNDIVTGPTEIGLDSRGSARCMESFDKSTPSRIAISCLLFPRKWEARFLGDKKDRGAFLQIIRKIQ